MQQQVALQISKRRCLDQGADLFLQFADSPNSYLLQHDNGEVLPADVALAPIENANARIHDSLAAIDTHADQQALRVQRTPNPQVQQNLPVEPEAQQANSSLAYEGRLDVLADLATSPRFVETSRPQLTNLPLQMPTIAADEITTTTGPPLAVVPAAWRYHSEPFQPQNGALQNSLLEHTGLNSNSHNRIIMAAAERQDEGHCSGGQSQHYINGNLALRS